MSTNKFTCVQRLHWIVNLLYFTVTSPLSTASAAMSSQKRKLSCILLENCLPKQIVKYCLDPYFQSNPFDLVVAHLQWLFRQFSSHVGFGYSCQDFKREYTSVKHCIFIRVKLSNHYFHSDCKWMNLEIRGNLKRLRHNAALASQL